MWLMGWNRLKYMRRWIWSLTLAFAGLVLLDGVSKCFIPNTEIIDFLSRWLRTLALVTLTLLTPTMLVLPFSKRQETETNYSKLTLAVVSIVIIFSSAVWCIILAFFGSAINPHFDAFEDIMM